MIRRAIGLLTGYADHPLLMGLLISGVLLFAAGGIVEFYRGGETAGWLGIYAVMALTMGLIGYGLVFTGKLVVNYRKQHGVS